MSKITIAGNVFVITLDKTLGELKQIERYRPDTLKLKDEEGNVYFKVGTGSNSINKNGASFNMATHDEHRYACITLPIPPEIENAVEYVTEYVASAFVNLKLVEERFDESIACIANNMAEIRRNITNVTDECEVGEDIND